MWQKYRIRVLDWLTMSKEEREFYIASEQLTKDYPLDSADRIAKGLLKPSR